MKNKAQLTAEYMYELVKQKAEDELAFIKAFGVSKTKHDDSTGVTE